MEAIYVIAISLQVCGAIVLLIGSYVNIETVIYKSIADKSDKAVMSGSRIKDIDVADEIRNAYLSRISLIYLATGYFLGVFGEISAETKVYVAVAIVIASAVFTALTYFLCGILAHNRQSKFRKQL